MKKALIVLYHINIAVTFSISLVLISELLYWPFSNIGVWLKALLTIFPSFPIAFLLTLWSKKIWDPQGFLASLKWEDGK